MGTTIILCERRGHAWGHDWDVTTWRPAQAPDTLRGVMAGWPGDRVGPYVIRAAARHFASAMVLVVDEVELAQHAANHHREPAYHASEAEQRAHDAGVQADGDAFRDVPILDV